MADSLAMEIQVAWHWLFQDELDLTTVSDRSSLEYSQGLADGVLPDQADRLWHDSRTLAAGATDLLDLTALTTILFGGSIVSSFAKIRGLLIVNTATTAGADLEVGGAGASGNAWAAPFADDQDAVVIAPADSPLLVMNKKGDWPVAPGASDVLRIHNTGAGPVTYRIVLVGTTA